MTELFKPSADNRQSGAPHDSSPDTPESTFMELVDEGIDQERRRISREAHESTVRLLSGLSLGLTRLKHAENSPRSAEIIAEMEYLLGEAQSELQLAVYLAHPPPLEALGLHDALISLVEGFGRRTGLASTLDWQGELRIFDRTTEVILYRVIQEALSNVYRHARATRVAVTIANKPDQTEIRIADNGIGMPSRPTHGIGLSGMRERLDEIGGQLKVRSAPYGTELTAMAPTRPRAPRKGPSSASAALRAICSKCSRTANFTNDEGISLVLREMAGEFGDMADRISSQ